MRRNLRRNSTVRFGYIRPSVAAASAQHSSDFLAVRQTKWCSESAVLPSKKGSPIGPILAANAEIPLENTSKREVS